MSNCLFIGDTRSVKSVIGVKVRITPSIFSTHLHKPKSILCDKHTTIIPKSKRFLIGK